jgi:hypothetical protein
MSAETTSELAGFHAFIGQQLRLGSTQLSPERALEIWRERQATLESVRRGLADVEAGRTNRALFIVRGETVHVLSVRGTGQDLVKLDDFDVPG